MNRPLGGPWITFSCGDTDYALDVFDVLELLPARTATPVPGGTDRLAGITTWRGRTLAVIDWPATLKAERDTPDLRKRMIVVRRPSPFALRVDAPGRIVGAGELEELTMEGGGADREARDQGVRLLRSRHGLVRVLDPRRILGRGSLVVGGEAPREDPE